MAVTILEALENADYNATHNGVLGMAIAKTQLHNAFILLQMGYSLYEEVEPLLEKHGDVENVPERNQ